CSAAAAWPSCASPRPTGRRRSRSPHARARGSSWSSATSSTRWIRPGRCYLTAMGRPLVLVPGACLGGWAWGDVARRLRAHGHDVHPATLTGLGARVHLARPDVDLETHVTDVVNLLDYEGLEDVVLVGHSYSGDARARRGR